MRPRKTLETIDIEHTLPRELLALQRFLDHAPLSVVGCDDAETRIRIVRPD